MCSFLQKKCMSSLAYPVEKGVPMCIFRKKSACPCWSTLLKRASLCAFCFDVSVGRLQGAAIADFLAGVSVGRLQGAATYRRFSGRRFCVSLCLCVSVRLCVCVSMCI